MTTVQTYATAAGVPVIPALRERRRIYRNGNHYDAVYFEFDVQIDRDQRQMPVMVTGQKYAAAEQWFRNKGYSREESEAAALSTLTGLGIYKILRALDDDLDLAADFASFPDSFLQVTDLDLAKWQNPGRASPQNILSYIRRRLEAAWQADDHDDPVEFTLADAVYLDTTLDSIYKVIDVYTGEYWDIAAVGALRPRQQLIREFLSQHRQASLIPSSERAVVAAASTAQTWDVALSFAGEERPYVDEVAKHLKELGVSVFYDQDHDVVLWGKNLAEEFQDIYMKRARVVVMFVSEAYSRKEWTRLERRSAFARAMREKQEYVLPVRMDATELPGLLPTVSYLPGDSLLPAQVATKIAQKLGFLP